MKTPIELHEQIIKSYIKYYESAFSLNDDFITKERRKLLQNDGILSKEPYLEVVEKYPANIPIEKACADAGLDEKISSKISNIILILNHLRMCKVTHGSKDF